MAVWQAFYGISKVSSAFKTKTAANAADNPESRTA
jgi:hypothetical protein